MTRRQQAANFILNDDMSTFLPVDEQMDLLAEGRGGDHPRDRPARAPRREPQDRPPAARQGRLRPHRARPAPRPHRADAQAAPLSAAGAHRHLSGRRLHLAHRRPHRPQRDPQAADPRADRRQRRDLQAAGLQDPRRESDRGALQLRVAGQAGLRRHDPAHGALHRLADARARRISQALPGRAAHQPARAALPA